MNFDRLGDLSSGRLLPTLRSGKTRRMVVGHRELEFGSPRWFSRMGSNLIHNFLARGALLKFVRTGCGLEDDVGGAKRRLKD